MDRSKKVFVYGSLKNPEVQREVIGRNVEGVYDIVRGFKLSKIKLENKIYPIAEKRRGSSLEGLVLYVTQDELKKIDEYEGNSYNKSKVKTELFSRYVWIYHK